MGDPQDAALRALVASLDLKKPRPPPIAVLSRRLMETLLVRDFCIRRATDSWEYKAWYSKTGECEWAGARHNLRATRAATGAEAASTQAMFLQMYGKSPEDTIETIEQQIEAFEAETAVAAAALADTLRKGPAGEVYVAFGSALRMQQLGNYVLSPLKFHKMSDKWVTEVVFPGGLTGEQLRKAVPVGDWEHAVKSYLRATGCDVTGHAEYAGSLTPVQDALNNANAYEGQPPISFKCASDAVAYYTSDANLVCYGGKAPGTGDPASVGHAALIAVAAAMAVHEQYLNGFWDQVMANIKFEPCVAYALAGFALVGDTAALKELATCVFGNNDPDGPPSDDDPLGFLAQSALDSSGCPSHCRRIRFLGAAATRPEAGLFTATGAALLSGAIHPAMLDPALPPPVWWELWSVRAHKDASPAAKTWVQTVLLCGRRIAAMWLAAGDSDEGVRPEGMLPPLPTEMLLGLLGQLQIGDMAV